MIKDDTVILIGHILRILTNKLQIPSVNSFLPFVAYLFQQFNIFLNLSIHF
jgi:hypothetical protein